MTIRQLKISGPAEVDLVWARLTDFDLWPTWSPQILRVESEDDRIRRGAVGTVRSLAAIGIPFVITEHDETARSWSWIVRLGLVTATMHHRVSSHQRAHSRPHGSKVDFTIESHPVLAAAYLPAAAVALTRLVK